MTDIPASIQAPDGQSYCVGVDVGGTFTDVVISDGLTIWHAKTPSTHGAIGEGVLEACRLAARQAGRSLEVLLERTSRFGLGTTAVTNVIASRVGQRVGLITNTGLEDLLPAARIRRIPHEGWLIPPDSLVARTDIRGVTGRIDRYGEEVQPLDEEAVVAAGRSLVEGGVETLVVSFLWSPANLDHERRAVALLRAALPNVSISSAAEMLPIVREFERTTFAVLNAYSATSLNGLTALISCLGELGLPSPPFLIHSGGGAISVDEARRVPVSLAESGPAAGVVGALAVCECLDITEAIVCDMGGTSYDFSIIVDGGPLRRSRGELMGVWTALPMIDIDSITAGGGSIGWVNALGLPQVGPHSAGAVPGPACYGRGGREPTVTDALVVLGHIDPDRFVGGKMPLDRNAAVQACARIGAAISSSAERIAWGMVMIARVNMANVLRARFARSGFDPRSFTLVSLGGCGGLFNVEVAREVGIRRVLVPYLTSVLSAFGAATADVRRERSISLDMPFPCPPEEVATRAEQLREAVLADLAADGIGDASAQTSVEIDLRFMRQPSELVVSADHGFDEAAQEAMVAAFKADYLGRYGSGSIAAGASVEIAALRVIGTGSTLRAVLNKAAPAASELRSIGRREVKVERHGQMVDEMANVYDGADLAPGHVLVGPALIDTVDTTIWLPAGARAKVDPWRTLDIEVGL